MTSAEFSYLASISGQVDLPASISAGSISALGRRCGIRLTP